MSKKGVIVLGVKDGIMQIYVNNNKMLITLEAYKSIVTYANVVDVCMIFNNFDMVLYRLCPSFFAIRKIARKITKINRFVLPDWNEKVLFEIQDIKKGKRKVKYITFNSNKVGNLFEQYEANKNLFTGFCNYNIDSLGNISDIEKKSIKNYFIPRYTLEQYLLDRHVNTCAERYISKIYKDFFAENEASLGDIAKIRFQKFQNIFKEVSQAVEEEDREDELEIIDRAYNSIVERNKMIKNIKKYINDSRITDDFAEDEISKALAFIYIREKLFDKKNKKSILGKLDFDYINPKLIMLLEENIVRFLNKDIRKNFNELDSIRYLYLQMDRFSLKDEEQEKILNVLKRYVNLIECMDLLGKNTKQNNNMRDEIGLVIDNYEEYIENGMLDIINIESVDREITKFLSLIKKEILSEKYPNVEIDFFDNSKHMGEKNYGEIKKYMYVVEDEVIHAYEDYRFLEDMKLEEVKKRYLTHDEKFIKNSNLSKISSFGNFMFLPSGKMIHVTNEYQYKNFINYYIYILKTVANEIECLKVNYIDLVLSKLEDDESRKFIDIVYDGNIYKVMEYVDKYLKESEWKQ